MGKMEMNLIKLALEKNTDVNLLNTAVKKIEFDFISESDFKGNKNIIIIGSENINKTKRIIELTDDDSQIIILEDNESIYQKMSKELDEYKTETGKQNCKIYKSLWENLKFNNMLINDYFTNKNISNIAAYYEFQKYLKMQTREKPLIQDEWADLVYISNMNRFTSHLAEKVMSQVFSLLKRYGQILVEIVLSDEKITKNIPYIYHDMECNNILLEDEVIDFLTKHSFHGIKYIWRAEIPILISDRVELRPFLMKAFKGKQGICLEKGHAVFYSGPWKEVVDDDGHKLVRGKRAAVCEKTFNVLTKEPYNNEVVGINPYYEVSDEMAALFDCNIRPERNPKVTKGLIDITVESENNQRGKCC